MRGLTAQELNARNECIDLAKAMGIILVIAGHVVSSDTVTKKIIYAFHMPLFFLLSGMHIRMQEKYSKGTWGKIIVKKAKVLLLPFVLWGLIYSSFSFKHMALILYGTRETLIAAESLTSLWFLPVLFLAYLFCEGVLQVVDKLRRGWDGIVIGSVVLAIIGFLFPHSFQFGNPWGIDIAFVAASFMLVGMLARTVLEKMTDIKCQIITLMASLILFIFTVRYSNSAVGYVLMANAEYGNAILFYVCALFGSTVILLMAYLLVEVCPKCLQSIGKKTMGIFLVHKPIIELGRSYATRLWNNFENTTFIILITIITLAISCFFVTIIQMIIPEIVGLKRRIGKGSHEQNKFT